MPLSARNQDSTPNQEGERSFSFDSSNQDKNKLPMIRIKKVMKKIGAVDQSKGIYVPPDEDQAAFRKAKWHELRQQYSTRRGQQQPFNYELD